MVTGREDAAFVRISAAASESSATKSAEPAAEPAAAIAAAARMHRHAYAMQQTTGVSSD